MLTDVLTNATVKAAIEALQKGDRKAWLALFESDAKLYDDGSPRPLQNSPTTRWGMNASPRSSASKITGSTSSAHSIRTGGATSEPISGFNCRRRARSNVLTSDRPSSANGARIRARRDGPRTAALRDAESHSGVAARNPAMTMAAITVNQMSSVGMTEIIAGLTHRYQITGGRTRSCNLSVASPGLVHSCATAGHRQSGSPMRARPGRRRRPWSAPARESPT